MARSATPCDRRSNTPNRIPRISHHSGGATGVAPESVDADWPYQNETSWPLGFHIARTRGEGGASELCRSDHARQFQPLCMEAQIGRNSSCSRTAKRCERCFSKTSLTRAISCRPGSVAIPELKRVRSTGGALTFAAHPDLRQKVLVPFGHIKSKLPGRWDFTSLELGANSAQLKDIQVIVHFDFSRFVWKPK